MLFNLCRKDARDFFFCTWRKSKCGENLSDLEKIAVPILSDHPEYHAVLDYPEQYTTQEWPPDMRNSNPFLHLGLHVAIEEQLSIDHPVGIRLLYVQQTMRLNSAHQAKHVMMNCLEEMIDHANGDIASFDVNRYLACIRDTLG
jgi:Domain of unknown function (DUF1841)